MFNNGLILQYGQLHINNEQQQIILPVSLSNRYHAVGAFSSSQNAILGVYDRQYNCFYIRCNDSANNSFLNNRTCLQWGTTSHSDSNYYVNITLPTSFSSKNYKPLFTDLNASQTTVQTSETTFCVYTTYTNSGSFRVAFNRTSIGGFYWVAIGY